MSSSCCINFCGQYLKHGKILPFLSNFLLLVHTCCRQTLVFRVPLGVGMFVYIKVAITCRWSVTVTLYQCVNKVTMTQMTNLLILGKQTCNRPMSEDQQGVNIYGHQVSDGGLEWYANIFTGGEVTSVGVQCGSGTSMNKAKLVVNKSSFGVHSQPPSCRKSGTICNFHLYFIS